MILEAKFDRLTGLLHESIGEQVLGEELLRARRYGGKLSGAFFKPHRAGDTSSFLYSDLKKLAMVARNVFRDIDLGIRVGGGVLFLLPGTSEEGAKICLEKLTARLRAIESKSNYRVLTSSFTFDGHFASERGLANPLPQCLLSLLEELVAKEAQAKRTFALNA